MKRTWPNVVVADAPEERGMVHARTAGRREGHARADRDRRRRRRAVHAGASSMPCCLTCTTARPLLPPRTTPGGSEIRAALASWQVCRPGRASARLPEKKAAPSTRSFWVTKLRRGESSCAVNRKRIEYNGNFCSYTSPNRDVRLAGRHKCRKAMRDAPFASG